jgi:hypothetical protein
MEFRLNLKLGNSEIEIKDEVEDTSELFRKVSFFTSLPSTCANCNGSDLGFAFRETKENYKYYSLKCKSCNYELRMGQSKSAGELFSKDWKAPYSATDDKTEVVEDNNVETNPLPEPIVEESPKKTNSVLERIKNKTKDEGSSPKAEPTSKPENDYASIIARVKAKQQKNWKEQ